MVGGDGVGVAVRVVFVFVAVVKSRSRLTVVYNCFWAMLLLVRGVGRRCPLLGLLWLLCVGRC